MCLGRNKLWVVNLISLLVYHASSAHGHKGHDHSTNHESSPDNKPWTTVSDDVTHASYAVKLSEFTDTAAGVHSHSSGLDPDGVMTLNWTPDYEKQMVVFTITGRTLGWVGLGISSNGGMDGADIVTAWIKDGQLFLQDRHGDRYNVPPLDAQGNWKPIAALENDTHTIITIARDFNTCDPEDFPLTNETTRFIYAWGLEDPTESYPPYHGTKRGTRFALALLPFHEPSPKTAPFNTWSVDQSMTLPHTKDTYYWCHVEKVPALSKKHQYVGFKMIYGENARRHLHHSVAFECRSAKAGATTEDVFQKYVGHEGHECYTPNMPDDFNTCQKFFINWAVGSEGEFLPATVGIPMGEEHGGPTYLLFQTHYDNPSLIKDIRVSWGMDIYYTDVLRENEGGNIALGHAINFALTIPPGQSAWLTTGHCSEHCTKAGLPQGGVRVFMVFLHAHYLGRAIRLRHFRGDRELPMIAQEHHFDANFQQARTLSEEVVVMPGDHLTVECDYDSHDRENATFSGWNSRDEMCQAFINYYPRTDMALCRSSPTVPTVRRALNMPTIPSDVDLSDYIFDMELTDGGLYQSSVNSIDWSHRNIGTVNRIMSRGEHFIKCSYNSQIAIDVGNHTTAYPTIVHQYTSPHDQTCAGIAIATDSAEQHGTVNMMTVNMIMISMTMLNRMWIHNP